MTEKKNHHLSLRPYQSQCVDHARSMNTIVCLPTGHGKTLIAVQRVDDVLSTQQKVGFLVPTRALVKQQAMYIQKHSTKNPRIQTLVGTDQASWQQKQWEECARNTDVFVGTAAVFTKAIVSDRFLDLRQFGLLVFDECRNAIGNSPMASILRDAVVPYYNNNNNNHQNRDKLSVLGLTASFVNGNLKNMTEKRRDLEALLQAKIFCPDTTSTNGKSSGIQFCQVNWSKDDLSDSLDIVDQFVEESMNRIGTVKEVKKVLSRCRQVLDELGRDPLLYFVQNIVIHQLLDKVKQLADDPNDLARNNIARTITGRIPLIQRECQSLLAKLQTDPILSHLPPLTSKLCKLLQLMRQIFASQVALVSPLAYELNKANINAGAIAGTGHQVDREREIQLCDFRAGYILVLVSTAALEEGIDVPECSFVVRYTAFSTTKSHIQGAGRARNNCGTIYYFCNEISVEKQKEASLVAMAKDGGLSLNVSELQTLANVMGAGIPGRHPYPFDVMTRTDHGLVTVFNCKQILNQYCSKVLGQLVSPHYHLYSYDDSASSSSNNGYVIEADRFPTPNGWRSVDRTQSDTFWRKVNLDILFPPTRSKNLSCSEKAELCIVYFAVVEIRERGLLNEHNQPNIPAADGGNIRQQCPLSGSNTASITIKSLVLQSRQR